MKMFNRVVVQEALKRSRALNNNPELISDNQSDNQDSVVSLLIHDVFGGEILKTHKKKGWYFYNRIDGERIDFTGSDMKKTLNNNHFEDIPATPDETCNYFEQEEYSNFFMRFIWAFEEAVGLEKPQPGYSA
jgi:phage pi2 protein 07